jgi:hypothetical protein
MSTEPPFRLSHFPDLIAEVTRARGAPAFIWNTANIRRNVVHAVVRSYSGKGAKEVFDIIEKNKAEVERLIRGIKGFVSYSMARTADGGFSVSVFHDKAGTDESIRVAREWIAKKRCFRYEAPIIHDCLPD